MKSFLQKIFLVSGQQKKTNLVHFVFDDTSFFLYRGKKNPSVIQYYYIARKISAIVSLSFLFSHYINSFRLNSKTFSI